MRDKLVRNLWVGLFLILAGSPARAENEWRTRTFLDAAAPGIIEAVVPAGLVDRSDDGTMDLSLAGPDGRFRSFELYWREPVDDTRVALTPLNVTLDELKGFVWEAAAPSNLLIRQLIVQLAADDMIGRIDVEGYHGGQWDSLVKNAAVFNTEGPPHGIIDLPEAEYEKLRLCLTGFDQHAKPKLAPIQSVSVVGERKGKDFAGQVLALPFQQSQTPEAISVEAALPGNGLWIRSLILKTEAQFLGSWQIGRETIVDGQKQFTVIQEGRVSHVDRRRQVFKIKVDVQWPGRSLVVRLDAGQHYIGEVSGLEADVRLPRLVFSAEKQGRYTLFSGTGQKISVLSIPGDGLRRPDVEVPALPAAETNPLWRTTSLVERFRLEGAAFNSDGYTWRSPVVIADPGYYRLTLSLAAVLKSPEQPIRITKAGVQIPFIRGRIESHGLEPVIEETFDAGKNQSQWTVQFPGPSFLWQNLTLHARGIFKRAIQFEHPKPGNIGWQPWRTAVWENRDLKETAFRLSLQDLPADVDRVRMIVDNGDNQPVEISEMTLRYLTPTFCFLAHQTGTYFVYGGNPKATKPRYDLSLVENELLSMLPEDVLMGDLEMFQPRGWLSRFGEAFKDNGWGLYAVLAVVTLVLIGIIVRMFPKGKPAG